MNIILDILGSTFIAGILLLMMLKLNIFASNASFSSDSELKMQQHAKTLGEIINYDLRKIGYKYTGTAISVADSNRIKFFADMHPPGTAGHGTMDVVEYFLSDTTKAAGTPNPRDIVLTRVLNNTDTSAGPSLGLVKLKFSYFNANSIPTTNKDSIKYVKTEFWIESSDPVRNKFTEQYEYPFTYWELTIYPRNI